MVNFNACKWPNIEKISSPSVHFKKIAPYGRTVAMTIIKILISDFLRKTKYPNQRNGLPNVGLDFIAYDIVSKCKLIIF